MDKIFVFELSESQGCFHISSLEDCLRNNMAQAERYFRKKMVEGEVHDYRPIFAGTEDQVYAFSERYRRRIAAINPNHAGFGSLEAMYNDCRVSECREKAHTN